ncbi:MAG: hypothetical protein MCS20_01475, partial [Candidatus Phytoplasma mali]|nr:hypothetical protein [Candidatus Karelsulcia muelleri]MCG7202065.1 hypothetical protein [Candidatus Phytoplasma mali]
MRDFPKLLLLSGFIYIYIYIYIYINQAERNEKIEKNSSSRYIENRSEEFNKNIIFLSNFF